MHQARTHSSFLMTPVPRRLERTPISAYSFRVRRWVSPRTCWSGDLVQLCLAPFVFLECSYDEMTTLHRSCPRYSTRSRPLTTVDKGHRSFGASSPRAGSAGYLEMAGAGILVKSLRSGPAFRLYAG